MPPGSKGGTVAHAAADAGSATPLTSTTMWSSEASVSKRPAKASCNPEPIVQQTHPFGRLTIWPEPESNPALSRSTSMPIEPKSLTITPIRRPSGCRSRWLISVVLPAPR